jgi:hypothetical protein
MPTTGMPTLTGITDDTGTAGDLVTNDTSLAFTGTAAPDSLVEIFVDGVSVAFGNADNSGDWSIDMTSQYGEFAEGSYAIQILQTLGGTTKISAAQTLTVDTTVAAPCIMGISPDAGIDDSDGITSSSTLVVFGEAEANSTIAIWDGATFLGTTVADPCGCWAYTTPALSDGTHSFTTIATDVAGNVSAASAARTMTVDTTVAAPVISPVITDDTGISDTDRITNDTTFTLTGTAEAFSTVTVHVDGTTTITGTVVADASGNWSFTTTELAGQSNYFCYATATDLAGNTSGHLSPVVVSLDTEAPTTVPVIGAISTDTGASATDGIARDRTVVLTGTGEANSLVEVLLDGNSLGIATVDTSGAWTFDYRNTVLTDGTYHFTARTTDAAGNASPLSGDFAVVIDTVAPAAAMVTGISDDSGVSGSDYVSNDTNLVIDGTAEANAVVEVFLDGLSRGTATADGSGGWSFDATAITLADGHHQLITRVSDVAGNSRLSAPVDVLVDTSAPVVPTVTSWGDDTYYFFGQFEAVGNGHDGITQDRTITLNGTGEAGSIITVFDGTAELGTAVVGAGGSWTYTTDPLIDGDHSLTATATDTAGNESGASAATNVHVDTTNPVRPAVTGIRYDTGTDATDGVTNDIHLVLMGTAEPGTRVWVSSFQVPPGYYVIGGGLGFEFADANGHWEVDLSNLEVFTATSPFHAPFTFTDGQYSFFAEAVDLASNGSGFGPSFTVTIDTTPPAAAVITGVTDDTGVSVTDAITNDTTLTLNGTAEPGTFIEVFEGTTSLGTVRTDGLGQWSFDLGAVSEGSHSYTADITDLAGNPGPQSSPFAITIDATAPDTTITANPSAPSNSASASFSFAGSDPGGTGVAGFEVSIDGGEFVAGVSPSDFNNLADGSHTVEVRAVDAAGNRDATPASFTWVVDTTGPDTTLTATPPSISASANASFSFTADDGSGTGVARFEVSLDGGGFSPAASPVVYTGLSDGPHTVVIRAIDALGNIEPTPATYTWTVDTTPPDAPVVVSPANASAVNDATIAGTAEPDSTVTVFIDGTAAGTATADDAGDWTFAAPTNLSDGSHTVRARASDAAGNSSVDSSTNTFALDTVAPVATAASVLSIDGDTGVTTGNLGAGHVVQIVVTTDDNVVVDTTSGIPALVLNDGGSASYVAAESDSTRLVFSYTVAASENTSSLKVTNLSLNGATIGDAVGNSLDASGVANADLGVEIDTTAPATPAAPVLASDTGISNTDKLTSDPRIAYPTPALGAVLLYSLDGSSFTTTAPVFATNGSVDGQRTVAIKEKDAAGNISGASSLTFTLDTLAPHITSDGGGDAATFAIAEKSTSVTTVVATDQHPVTYSIVGGVDQSAFRINATTGALSFITSPDFENPTDADHSGSYIVRVRASDGSLTAEQTITVNVTDVPETTHWMQSVSIGAHPAGWAPAAVADFNADGTSDVLWHNAGNNDVETWQIAAGQWAGSVDIGSHPPGYNPAGAGDFNHDGTSDVFWYNPTTRDTDIWLVNNGGWAGSTTIGQHPAGYQVSGIGDFNNDGTSDVFWYNPTTRDTDIWFVNNGQWAGSTTIGQHPAGYQVAGIGDFNKDGTSDVLWVNPATNETDIWLVNDGHWAGSTTIGTHPAGYQVAGVGDFNQDRTSDVVWYNPTTNDVDVWLVQNGHWAGSVSVGAHPPGWQLMGIGDFDHNGVSDIMWRDSSNGGIETWLLGYS